MIRDLYAYYHYTCYIISKFIGHEVAEFVKEHLIEELRAFPSFKEKDYERALIDVYLKMDSMIQTTYGKSKL